MLRATVLVVEDEPIARRRLIRMLRRFDTVSVVGEAGDVNQAVAEARRLQPDLLLLDIQIPGGDGFGVIEKLGAAAPQTIFVTAYDQHALRAFEVDAIDYVTKPVDPVRLGKAIDRAMTFIAARKSSRQVAELTTTVQGLRKTLADTATPSPSLWIKQRSGLLRVEIEDILYGRAERDYVQLHLMEKTCLYPENMATLEGVLSAFGFVRIHRSTIVRVKAIQQVQRSGDGRLMLQMIDDARLPIGRTYVGSVRRQLGA